jgi:hypothetical protein
MKYDKPINKEKDKLTRIDKDTGKVKTERRGIYANPLRTGFSTTPGILFGEFKEDAKELKNLARELKKQRPRSLAPKEQAESKFPFKPASLKNGTFQTDKELYGEDLGNIKNLLKTAMDTKKRGQKYSPEKVEKEAEHMGAFKPASLGKTVSFLSNG